MKYFYPDSVDVVDPSFDFQKERPGPQRVRQRSELYAHELLERPPYDGILVSMSITDRRLGKGRYTEGQRMRLLRNGARRFFRLDDGSGIRVMGDCGAYAYVSNPYPPFPVSEVLDFYQKCGVDFALSVDHVIPWFLRGRATPKPEWVERRQISQRLACDFLEEHRRRRSRSVPIGVAQGWDCPSYSEAARELTRQGYGFIAIGGLASLNTKDVVSVVDAVAGAVKGQAAIHLLGISRIDSLDFFQEKGVVSIDSAMPMRQSFMDDKHNYHTLSGAFLAIRVPQTNGNQALQVKIRKGRVSLTRAVQLERSSLSALRAFDNGRLGVRETVRQVVEYERLFNGKDHSSQYEKLLSIRPWRVCTCQVCRSIGIDVVLLRGRERNKRRGFHNMTVLHERIRRCRN